MREGPKPPGSLWQLPAKSSLQSAACGGGPDGSGGAGHQRRETRVKGGERGAAAGGEHPDGFWRGGDGGGPGDEAAGPPGRPQVCPDVQRPQELSGPARKVSQHVEEADRRQRPRRSCTCRRSRSQSVGKRGREVEVGLNASVPQASLKAGMEIFKGQNVKKLIDFFFF